MVCKIDLWPNVIDHRRESSLKLIASSAADDQLDEQNTSKVYDFDQNCFTGHVTKVWNDLIETPATLN